MRNVTVETKLTIKLTAQDWQLYSSMDGADATACAMSAAIQGQLNGAHNIEEARRDCYRVLHQYNKWGAYDTEPRAVLERLIALRFPQEHRNWG